MNRPNPWDLPPATDYDAEIRRSRFRELIHVAGDHPIIQYAANAYATGACISFEEALQQIIRHLVRENRDLKTMVRDGRLGHPVTITKEMLGAMIDKLASDPPTATGAKIQEDNENRD